MKKEKSKKKKVKTRVSRRLPHKVPRRTQINMLKTPKKRKPSLILQAIRILRNLMPTTTLNTTEAMITSETATKLLRIKIQIKKYIIIAIYALTSIKIASNATMQPKSKPTAQVVLSASGRATLLSVAHVRNMVINAVNVT